MKVGINCGASRPAVLAAALALLAGAACGDGGDGDGDDVDGDDGDARYVISSVVFSPEGNTTYMNVLDSVESQDIDYGQAVELPGWADSWVHEGSLFVSDGESPTITKFSLGEDGQLVEDGRLSFASYGQVDAAFWSNTFVGPSKAYMLNGVAEYVIWDPDTMAITGTMDLPALEPRDGLQVRTGTVDRSNVIRDGLLFQPMYWSDADYVRFADDSLIAVIDIERDEVVDVIEAPCSAPDVGTQDGAGNLYFSTWTGGVYGPLLLDAPANCVTLIPAGEATASVAFSFADVAEGREGAAVRHVGDGRFVFPVFHDERVDFESGDDPWALIGGENWRLWIYDADSAAASPLDSIDWNSGAAYTFDIDGRVHALIPGSDYASTTVYSLDDDLVATALFETRGWAIRLFRIR